MRRLLLSCLLILPIAACSAWDGRSTSLGQRPAGAAQDTSAEGLYASGMAALEQQEYARAGELFDTVEREHP